MRLDRIAPPRQLYVARVPPPANASIVAGFSPQSPVGWLLALSVFRYVSPSAVLPSAVCCKMSIFLHPYAWQNSSGTASTTSTATSALPFGSNCLFKPSRPSTRARRSASGRWNSPRRAMIPSGATASSGATRNTSCPSLLPEFAGKVDLIYIDPPFDTGADFSFSARIPGNDSEEEDDVRFEKSPSVLEQKAYRDTWGRGLGSYLQWFYEAAVQLREMLSESGSIYVHIGPNMSHYVKAVLDEVFGIQNYINEIIWRRAFGHGDSGRFGIIHDCIFLYGKTQERVWNTILQRPDPEYIKTFFDQYDETRGERYQRISLSALGLSGGGYDYEYKGVRTLWRCPIETLKKHDEEGRLHWPKKRAAYHGPSVLRVSTKEWHRRTFGPI